MLLVAPVFYGVFYPQPYLGQLVRKIPIAVVDDDRTVLSRRLIQALDADEEISVAVRAPALDAAQQALFDRRVFGILEIPPDTEREVLKRNKARIPAYVACPVLYRSAASVRILDIRPGCRSGAVRGAVRARH